MSPSEPNPRQRQARPPHTNAIPTTDRGHSPSCAPRARRHATQQDGNAAKDPGWPPPMHDAHQAPVARPKLRVRITQGPRRRRHQSRAAPRVDADWPHTKPPKTYREPDGGEDGKEGQALDSVGHRTVQGQAHPDDVRCSFDLASRRGPQNG